ncbi:MAG TPA: hypothetical protein VHC98_00275, partial [Candidatus Saccharimonadales bacterium]|nr:hypothetical protein [Candidatus Saccharimonadales bacterium]
AALAPTGCGDSQGQFVGDLQAARQQLQLVRAADRTIRQQLTGHVLPDLQAYSEWLQQQAASAANASADVHATAGASVTTD